MTAPTTAPAPHRRRWFAVERTLLGLIPWGTVIPTFFVVAFRIGVASWLLGLAHAADHRVPDLGWLPLAFITGALWCLPTRGSDSKTTVVE